MTNSVRELVEAAKELLTKRGSSFDIVGHDHLGHPLNAEGMAAMKTRAAIAAVEAEGDGWIEIKEGCEMPVQRKNVLVYTQYWSSCPFVAFWANGEWHGERILSRPDSVTHWRPLPPSPTVSGKEPK